MRNYKRYKKIDYSGLLSSFIASGILHCILFAIAATTTIFYPPTADREMISVDLLFASPVSGSPDISLQKLAQRPSSQPEEQDAIEDNEADATEPVNAALPDVQPDSQDIDLMTMTAPKPEKKRIPTVKLPPPPVKRPKIAKVNKVPPPAPAIIPLAEKAPEVEPKPEDAVKPVVAEPVPPPVLAEPTKALEQTDQDRVAVENEKIRRQQETERMAAEERAQEEARAARIAKATELERQAAEKAARLKAVAENEKARRLLEAEQRAAIEKAREAARAAKIAKAAELERRQAEKAAKVKLAAEKAKIERAAAEKARREQVARLKKEEEKSAKEKLAHQRAEAAKIAQEKLAQARLLANSKNNENALPVKPANGANAASSVKTEGAAIAAAIPPVKPLIASTVTNTENNQPKDKAEQKGLALPPVNGDIKLIVTSEDDLTVKVLFVSYPKARHDRPLNKKEAKEQQKLSPIVVKTAKNTLEAVIERSREGIYIFQLDQKGSKPANGKFSLKLFESKNKSIASREIKGPTEIARLLMPDGILWEDDTAFSGNIEDSDSVTKFNSESGLVWKEYRK